MRCWSRNHIELQVPDLVTAWPGASSWIWAGSNAEVHSRPRLHTDLSAGLDEWQNEPIRRANLGEVDHSRRPRVPVSCAENLLRDARTIGVLDPSHFLTHEMHYPRP